MSLKTIKTIIAVLIAGSSSVALAHPVTIRDHRDNVINVNQPGNLPASDQYGPDGVIDHECYPGHDHSGFARPVPGTLPADFRIRPVILRSDMSLPRQTWGGRSPTFVAVGDRLRGLNKLRFSRDAGRTYVDSVIVMLPNGRYQTYNVRQMLTAQNPSITVDIQPTLITGIWVYGTSMRPRSSFDLLAFR